MGLHKPQQASGKMSTSPRTPLCHSTASTPNSTGVKIIIMGIILLSLVPLVLVTQFLMKNENNFELDQQMIMPEQRLVDDDRLHRLLLIGAITLLLIVKVFKGCRRPVYRPMPTISLHLV